MQLETKGMFYRSPSLSRKARSHMACSIQSKSQCPDLVLRNYTDSVEAPHIPHCRLSKFLSPACGVLAICQTLPPGRVLLLDLRKQPRCAVLHNAVPCLRTRYHRVALAVSTLHERAFMNGILVARQHIMPELFFLAHGHGNNRLFI